VAEDMGEKTEQPTGKRLSDARDKGKTARSADLSGALLLTGATIATMLFGAGLFAGLGKVVSFGLASGTLATDLTGGRVGADLATVFWHAARLVAPFVLLMMLVAAVAQVLQVGLMLSSKILSPSLSRLNPLTGAKRLFSVRSVVRAGLDVLKLVLLLVVATLVVRSDWEGLLALAAIDLWHAIEFAIAMAIKVTLWILAVLLVLGIVDWMYQRWQHAQDLKMTKHEVKDERRAAEGDPETRARRLRFARSLMVQRLQHDVPKADVVVTNPTHFSVALRYESGGMSAPKVVAKGADEMALRIRFIATAHGVPIVERPPLARALYAECPVGREIPTQHYQAVAEILAYVYRLEGKAAS
jgi:flagellar biosynthetic protein FlhB